MNVETVPLNTLKNISILSSLLQKFIGLESGLSPKQDFYKVPILWKLE